MGSTHGEVRHGRGIWAHDAAHFASGHEDLFSRRTCRKRRIGLLMWLATLGGGDTAACAHETRVLGAEENSPFGPSLVHHRGPSASKQGRMETENFHIPWDHGPKAWHVEVGTFRKLGCLAWIQRRKRRMQQLSANLQAMVGCPHHDQTRLQQPKREIFSRNS